MALSTSSLFRLPRELRDQIYQNLIPTDLLHLSATCRESHVEFVPLLRAQFVLELQQDIDETAPVESLRRMPATIRDWLQRAIWYISSIDADLKQRIVPPRREIWNLLRSRLSLTELTIIYELPGTWYVESRGHTVQDTTLEMVLRDENVASRKRLILCYQPQNADHFTLFGLGSPMSLWVDMCGRLSTIMKDETVIEALEIWLPQDEVSEHSMNYAEISDIDSVRHWRSMGEETELEWQKPHWILPLLEIKGLKDLKLRLYNAYEPLSQQSQAVDTETLMELELFLCQKMGIRQPSPVS